MEIVLAATGCIYLAFIAYWIGYQRGTHATKPPPPQFVAQLPGREVMCSKCPFITRTREAVCER